MEYHKGAHGVWGLKYHVVWVCKYRRRVLNRGVAEYLRVMLRELLRSMQGVAMEEVGFDEDHLHMLLEIPPKYAIADVMGQLKAQTASGLRKRFTWLEKVYWKENVVWSPGYFVRACSIN
jgi:putative transposase